MKAFWVFLAVLCLAGTVFVQGAPFDQNGVLIESAEACVALQTLSGSTYQLKGDRGEFMPGDSVHVVGIYYTEFSICLLGNCCVTITSIESFSLGPQPKIPSFGMTGIILLVISLGLVGLWGIRRRILFFKSRH